MARKLELEVSNFIVRFGEKFVLGDMMDEIVLPAFFSGEKRTYGDTSYFFYEPEFRLLDPKDKKSFALVCRFVKDTVLKRHQIFSERKGIVEDEDEIKSAPSALAILLLNTHRLLYIKEVPGAPTAKQFGATFRHFLREATMEYQESQYDQLIDEGEKATKKGMKTLYPIPSVDVVPIVAKESLKKFLNRFELLRTLKVELAQTNNEVDNDELFKDLRIVKDNVGSKKTVVTHQNTKGLDTKGCFDYIEAANQGNLFVEMSGRDEHGDKLKGSNENFSVKAELSDESDSRDARVDEAFEKYSGLVDEKVVQIGDSEEDMTQSFLASLAAFQAEHGV